MSKTKTEKEHKIMIGKHVNSHLHEGVGYFSAVAAMFGFIAFVLMLVNSESSTLIVPTIVLSIVFTLISMLSFQKVRESEMTYKEIDQDTLSDLDINDVRIEHR
jgi:hypothetical protein